MEKFRDDEHPHTEGYRVGPSGVRQRVQPFNEEKSIDRERRSTPDEMVRQLQGVFCKGRYRSWSASVANR
ncbi:MAG: hypothetical protein LBQ46_10725 [Treponema sp.]|jgi:hypothetical protein|nr:hypothetical protein [Treponema sp.]